MLTDMGTYDTLIPGSGQWPYYPGRGNMVGMNWTKNMTECPGWVGPGQDEAVMQCETTRQQAAAPTATQLFDPTGSHAFLNSECVRFQTVGSRAACSTCSRARVLPSTATAGLN
jgi:hypothetical protein